MRLLEITLEGAVSALDLRKAKKKETRIGAAMSREETFAQSVSQSVSPAPRSPLHRLVVRLRHSRSNTSSQSHTRGFV